MAQTGKRVRAAREGVDRVKTYPLADAVRLVKERATAKFDETVELAMNLGVDPRHADQMVRGVCNLPNGSGRTVRVAVFARRSEEHTSELQSRQYLVCRLLLEKKKKEKNLTCDVQYA